jgi:hypothetical protein
LCCIEHISPFNTLNIQSGESTRANTGRARIAMASVVEVVVEVVVEEGVCNDERRDRDAVGVE